MDRARYVVGVITLLLAAAGGMYLVNLLGDEDKSLYFRLHVEFHNVEGLLSGADVRYRGVQVGSIRRVDLRDDGKKGIAVLVLSPGTEELACVNSKFWIVTPRFGGLAGGASGLETLVRDAYVSFLTPEPRGARLANASTVLGLEQPFSDQSENTLAAPRRGDLLMTLLIPENHGLAAGSEVRFRGVKTGEVRDVDLAQDGSHLRVTLRVDRKFRQTVTDETRFWVARPRLSGTVLQGLSLDDISALLIPFVGYYTETGKGLPVSDGHVVAAEVERPEIAIEKIVPAVEASPEVRESNGDGESIQAVRIVYEAIEEDSISADDEIRREGTGVLYQDREGYLRVLTTRSVCDASYFERDTFGADPEIRDEQFRVVLVDGTVLRGRRTWVGEKEDIALLTVDVDSATRADVRATPHGFFVFGVGEPADVLRTLDVERQTIDTPRTEEAKLPPVDGQRGALALADGRIVGILGQTTGTDIEPVLVPITVLPESLRPKP